MHASLKQIGYVPLDFWLVKFTIWKENYQTLHYSCNSLSFLYFLYSNSYSQHFAGIITLTRNTCFFAHFDIDQTAVTSCLSINQFSFRFQSLNLCILHILTDFPFYRFALKIDTTLFQRKEQTNNSNENNISYQNTFIPNNQIFSLTSG